LELARRHLHVFGPATPAAFAGWSGLKPPRTHEAFDALRGSLVPVQTPIGEAWILASDEDAFRAAKAVAPARLLPSGDAFFLLQGHDRELLVPDAKRRASLWTSRVWPGAVLVGGEVVGTWRRAHAALTVQPWTRLLAGVKERRRVGSRLPAAPRCRREDRRSLGRLTPGASRPRPV